MIRKAFLLGAGLGTRLRPLTDHLPKPLVPLFHRPLASWAMDACATAGIEEFAINTHHLPGTWRRDDSGLEIAGWRDAEIRAGNGAPVVTGDRRGLPVTLFHEPELLETGGGIRNIAAWAGDDDVLVHNGDIHTTLPLERLIAAHEASGHAVTLALRAHGPAKHVAIEGDRVLDIREMLGRAPGTHLFTGVYCFSPELLGRLPAGEKVSVIPAFLELARESLLGAVVLDEGDWRDLGDIESYLAAHRELALAEPVHPEARIAADAVVERSVVGPRAEISAGAVVRDAVVWPGARVSPGESVAHAVVTS